MNEPNWERWGAASGYLVLALGVAAAAFERGAPLANAPVEEAVAFFTAYRRELLAQSLLFALSAGLYLWFFGSLRVFLARAEGAPGRLAGVAFGAGVVWAGLQLVFQSGQIALARGSAAVADPALVGLLRDLTYALSVVAYVPMAILLAAVAAATLRWRAFPLWLGWLSALSALANLAMALGIVVDGGPLVPGGWLTYVLYALMPVWLVAATTVMVARLGRPSPARAAAEARAGLGG